MEKNSDIEKLMTKYLLGVLTKPEQIQLEAWIEISPRHKTLFDRIRTDTSLRERYEDYIQIDSNRAWRHFQRKYISYRLYPRVLLRYAAIFLLPLLIAAGISYYHSSRSSTYEIDNIEIAETIQPGSSKAVLLLPGNKREILSSSSPSRVTVSSSSTAITTQSGTLVYSPSSTEKVKEEVINNNTLATDRGSEFRVTFEDGTTVHLNYNTELRYPVKFSSSKRMVYLKGEAYFTVAKDSRPFYVVTEEGTIKQYGTEFNVNTLTPGRTEVVLVKGSIGITSIGSNSEQRLTPGQLAYTQKGADNISIYTIDITPYVAWNDGRLIFEERTLENIMEVLKHWYNVEVTFASPELRQLRFTGNMDRYATITPILKAIARTTNLRINIEGRNIIIASN